MRGAAWVLAIAVVGGGSVGWILHSRGGAVDRQLDAELAAALDRGGIADLGRAQALGRRLVLGAGGGRAQAALAFADARLAIDYGVPTAAEAEETCPLQAARRTVGRPFGDSRERRGDPGGPKR